MRDAARTGSPGGKPPRRCGGLGAQAAAQAAVSADALLAVRPRGRRARCRPRDAPGHPSLRAAWLQDRTGVQVPRHAGYASGRQFRLNARRADRQRGAVRGAARPRARALRCEDRDPRFHNTRLARPRAVGRGGPTRECRPGQRATARRLQIRRRAPGVALASASA